MYAIIPDIHGDLPRLEATLRKAGFQRSHDENWVHPEGTRAVFLGDFIDGGSENRKVIRTVRAMQAAGSAHAIMGNHELNAILYHTPDRDGHGWLRERSRKNAAQHETFLREYAANSDTDLSMPADRELADVLAWFRSLPLFLELEGFRIVHAQWDEAAIRTIRQFNSDGLLSDAAPDDFLDLGSGLGFAVERLLKGMEIVLPDGVSFHDFRHVRRSEMRLKWWADGERTYRNLSLSVPDPSAVPDEAVPDADRLFDFRHGGKPVFVGHYKMHGVPVARNEASALCLDYPGTPCYYHWMQGDSHIREDRLVIV